MASQDTNLPDLKLGPLLGLNERAAKNAIPPGEWETLQGLYPSRAGLLSRIPGKELYLKLDSAVYAIHQTNDGSGAILIQTASDLRRVTLDELRGRAYTPSLTPTTLTEEENMAYALLVHKEAANTDGGSIAITYGQRKLTDIVQQVNTDGTTAAFVTALGAGSGGVTGAFTLAAGTYRFRIKCWFFGTSGERATFRLWNTTAGANAFAGSVFSDCATAVMTATNNNVIGYLEGQLTIATPSQFELQDKATAARATNGRGLASKSAGTNEIYAVVEILQTST